MWDPPASRSLLDRADAATARARRTRADGANVDTTLNVYSQVVDGSVREAVEKVGGELLTIVHKRKETEGTTVG